MTNKAELLTHLMSFMTDERRALFLSKVEQRTRHITVAIENIYQSHNASAVLRSCDCFGVQDVHMIENSNEYTINPDVALGSSKWLTLNRYNQEENNTATNINALKEAGYMVVGTTPHTDTLLSDLPIEKPFALMFGNEKDGLSEEALSLVDQKVKIPMYGFTESFNISVSASICLYDFTERLRKSSVNWQLSESEKEEILLEWTRNTVKESELIEGRYINEFN